MLENMNLVLRDCFAMAALQGLANKPGYMPEELAEQAWKLADAMLSQRFKQVPADGQGFDTNV